MYYRLDVECYCVYTVHADQGGSTSKGSVAHVCYSNQYSSLEQGLSD